MNSQFFENMRIVIALLFICALAFGVKARDLFEQYNIARGKTLAPLNVEKLADEGVVDPEQPLVSDLNFRQRERAYGVESIEPAAGGKEEKAPKMDIDIPEGIGAAPMPEDTDWRDATDEDMEYSGIQSELFDDLMERRKDLEGREKELAMREALLQAAERELDQKYEELELLRGEIQSLLEQQSQEEQDRISSLVKIYEGMKAKDAARIFNTLETDVLLAVLGRMSERKSAPILAAMNPDRARSITILLAEQKTLINLSE